MNKDNEINQGIYYIYSENHDLLYIGKSINIHNRIKNHISSKEWIVNGCYVKVSYMENKANIDICEPYLISKLKPKYNKEYTHQETTTYRIAKPKQKFYCRVFNKVEFKDGEKLVELIYKKD